MKNRYYLAYGSNLNVHQMQYRCPGARVVGKTMLNNFELIFMGRSNSGVASIRAKRGSSVPVAIWEINEENEKALDRYEGYPTLYRKEFFPAKIDGEDVDLMVYIMNDRYSRNQPSKTYYNTIKQGYEWFGFDVNLLDCYAKKNLKVVKNNT